MDTGFFPVFLGFLKLQPMTVFPIIAIWSRGGCPHQPLLNKQKMSCPKIGLHKKV
jgi:hypothetical protein